MKHDFCFFSRSPVTVFGIAQFWTMHHTKFQGLGDRHPTHCVWLSYTTTLKIHIRTYCILHITNVQVRSISLSYILHTYTILHLHWRSLKGLSLESWASQLCTLGFADTRHGVITLVMGSMTTSTLWLLLASLPRSSIEDLWLTRICEWNLGPRKWDIWLGFSYIASSLCN